MTLSIQVVPDSLLRAELSLAQLTGVKWFVAPSCRRASSEKKVFRHSLGVQVMILGFYLDVSLPLVDWHVLSLEELQTVGGVGV